MITTIVVDGCDYTVEHTKYSSNQEDVFVRDINNVPVGSAEIYHDVEQVMVTYHDNEPAYYSYFEYTTPVELAEWIVGTSY
jgi:hypothetical protein